MHLALRKIFLGGIAAAAATLIATGCTLVGDSLTGVSLSRSNPSSCIKTCVETLTEGVQAEATLHQAQIAACQGLADPQRGQCIATEAARHAAAMAHLAAARSSCLNDCHRQGSGSAG